MDLSKLLSSFTTDIVCHAVSGKSFRGGGRNELFRELVETSSMLIGGFNLEDYFPKLARLDVVRSSGGASWGQPGLKARMIRPNPVF